MLLAVTPNPALDRTMVVPDLRLGHVHRAERIMIAAGGKGMNVARAAHTLEQPLRICAPLGGFTGQLVAQLAADEGFEGWWSWHRGGETRTCVLIVDPHGSDATVVNEHGATLSSDDWQDFVQTILAAAHDGAYATISGSLPPGVPPTALAELLSSLAERGCRALVDTSGAALTAALNAAPYAVKVNNSELAAALQQPLNNTVQAVSALTEVRARGVALAVVSLGADGALAASDEGMCWVRPPACKIVSTVGAGDSLMAGLVTGLLRGLPLAEALRLGVACGTADALTIGGGLIDRAEVDRLLTAATVIWMSEKRGA